MITISNHITPSLRTSWSYFLSDHPHNTVYQSPEMYAFYRKVKNFNPYIFFSYDHNNKINGVLLAVIIKEGKGLKGYFSSRVVVYGGPLIQDGENKGEILEGLLKSLTRSLKNKSIFIQFRNLFQWSEEEKNIFYKFGYSFRERLNSIVLTIDEKRVWANLSESRRRQIRKGLKSGVIVEEPKNEDEVKQFYQLLFDLYMRKVKKPLPAWSFFKTFYLFSKENRLGIIRLIKLNHQIIGGVLSPVTPGKNIYEWYTVGLDKDFKYHYPSVLATWTPIQYAIDNNLHHFDFMGLGLPEKEYGVRGFKMKFGGELVNYGRFARRNNKLFYFIAEFGYNLFRLLK